MNLISGKSLLYSIMMAIPEEDRVAFKNLEEFIKIRMHRYVDKILPEKYWCNMIKPVDIVNGVGEFREDHDCIMMIVGSKDSKVCNSKRWRKEVAAVMEKGADGCNYTVFADCDACSEPDCNHPIIMAAKEVGDKNMLMKGQQYHLVRHYYGVGEKGEDYTWSYDDNWFMMCPTNAAFFGMKHDKNCVGLSIRGRIEKLTGRPYEYDYHNGQIRVGFEQGKILVAYLGKLKDEKGMVMIPDNGKVKAMIEARVLQEVYMHMSRVFKKPAYTTLYQMHKQDFLECEGDGMDELFSIDPNDMMRTLAQVRDGWSLNRDEMTLAGVHCPDWVRILENKRTEY